MLEVLTNSSSRKPSFNNADIFEISSEADVLKYFPLQTAPDGVERSKIPKESALLVHEEFVWPDLWLDEQTSATGFQGIGFIGKRPGMKMLFLDGVTHARIWGRGVVATEWNSILPTDAGNGGAGQSTILWDITGVGFLSLMIVDVMAQSSFFDLGVIQDVNLVWGNVAILNAGKGVTVLSRGSTGVHEINIQAQFLGVSNTTPSMTFNGDLDALTFQAGNDTLAAGLDFVGIDSAVSGVHSFLGTTFNAAINGNFFRGDLATKSITLMEDVAVTVDTFVDSPLNPGTHVFGIISAYANVKVGQTILLSGNYAGFHVVTAVVPSQLNFEFLAAFGTGVPGTLERTRFTTSTPHTLTEGATHTAAGTTSYDATREVLFIENSSDDTFVVSVAFVAPDNTGTIDATFLDQSETPVETVACGDVPSSARLSAGIMNANATATTIVSANTYVSMNMGIDFFDSDVSERFELVTGTKARYRYIDPRPISLVVNNRGQIIKSGATDVYNITVTKNAETGLFNTSISSVANVSGFAEFSHGGAPPDIGQILAIKGYTGGASNYNGLHTVTSIGGGIFQVGIAFSINQATGEFESPFSSVEVKTTQVPYSHGQIIKFVEFDEFEFQIAAVASTSDPTIVEAEQEAFSR